MCKKCKHNDECDFRKCAIIDVEFILKVAYEVVGCKRNGSIIIYPIR